MMMVAPEIEKFLRRTFPGSLQTIVPSLVIVITLPLAFQTYLYNRVWSSSLALWQHNSKVDPNSSLNLTNLASELAAMNRHQEALDALNNSIKIKKSATAVLGRGRSLLYLNRFDEAVPDLQWVIALPNEEINAYTLYQSYESLAIALTGLRKFDEAQRTLMEARQRLPIYAAALTEKLAVVLYQAGNRSSALSELEAAREKAKTELLPESKSVLLRLGMLYAELGRKEDARRVLQEYLSLTAPLKDSVSLADREQAAILLRKLS